MKNMVLSALVGIATMSGLHAATNCSSSDIYESVCYNPCNSNCSSFLNGVSLDVDFLWWNTRAENILTQVAVENTAGNDTTSSRTDYHLDYKWNPGYRILLAYDTCVCGNNVELFAKWTWFRTSSERSLDYQVVVDQRVNLFDSYVGLSEQGENELAYANSSSFLYERFDLGFISGCYSLGYFEINPSVAVTGVFVKDTYRTFISATVPESSQTASVNAKYAGAGVTLGAEVSYPLMNCISLYSVSELTGLWGKIDTDYLIGNTTESLPTVFTQRGTNDYWSGRFIFTQELGVEYATCVYSFPVNLHMSWEFIYLPSMVLIGNAFVDDRTVNGLVAGAAVGF